ncbi:MAG: gamma-glutamylcyclotransferase [Gemmobacter sp.]
MRQPLWVFGYGSLIWDPGFPVAERRLARARGWRRGFCMWSIHHRGSMEEPGLVLALDHDPDSACDGVAFRVAEGAEAATLAGLRERELISSAYLEDWLEVEAEGAALTALCYVINRNHAQYCGGLSAEEQARVIAAARGGKGENCDYLYATAAHLAELGIADAGLERLAARVRALREG